MRKPNKQRKNATMKAKTILAAAIIACAAILIPPFYACTGITLKAQDGAVVYGRTMEWGSFDLHSRVVIVPRGHKFIGQTPDGKQGISWEAKYGVVGLDGVEKDIVLDGMN